MSFHGVGVLLPIHRCAALSSRTAPSLRIGLVDRWGRLHCRQNWGNNGMMINCSKERKGQGWILLSKIAIGHGSRCLAVHREVERKVSREVQREVRQQQQSQHQQHQDLYGVELRGFAERVAACNARMERKGEFIPFVVENDILGHVHHRFASYLRRFPDVFSVHPSSRVVVAPSLSSPEERTAAVQGVLNTLRDEGLIVGWRDELLPVTTAYGAPAALSMERAAVPHFGIKSYGVHMNGYVIAKSQNGAREKQLWVAKRSESKPTFPGMLDHIVAGGQPVGISAKDNIVKECEEEAGIPFHLAEKAVAVGAVSYEVVIGETLKRDVLFCYDLELPEDFKPCNADGEVESFVRLSVSEVYDIIAKSERYKPNCALVLIDFFIRHGYITPEQKGYMSLLQSLRIGEL